MFGRSGNMYIGEFVEICHRNAYRPDIRFFKNRWGSYQNVPNYFCTLVWGDPDNGDCLNIPTPEIPERPFEIDENWYLEGWRDLFSELIRMRWLRPSEELKKLLGDKDFSSAVGNLGCY